MSHGRDSCQRCCDEATKHGMPLQNSNWQWLPAIIAQMLGLGQPPFLGWHVCLLLTFGKFDPVRSTYFLLVRSFRPGCAVILFSILEFIWMCRPVLHGGVCSQIMRLLRYVCMQVVGGMVHPSIMCSSYSYLIPPTCTCLSVGHSTSASLRMPRLCSMMVTIKSNTLENSTPIPSVGVASSVRGMFAEVKSSSPSV